MTYILRKTKIILYLTYKTNTASNPFFKLQKFFSELEIRVFFENIIILQISDKPEVPQKFQKQFEN
jgi:hypothetical protein